MESLDTETPLNQLELEDNELDSLRITNGGGGGGGGLRPTSAVSNTSVTTNISLWLAKLRARPEIVFLSQMLVIYIVILVSLFNLTRGSSDQQEGKLWLVLLSSCLGYILPNPKITKHDSRPIQ